jgi:hypothetical protein
MPIDNELILSESERHRCNLVDTISRWAKHTKADFMLRSGDVEGLALQVLGEFYHVTLSCGHLVMSIDDGVLISFKDNGDEVQGYYCRECADKYKKEIGAIEIKIQERK